MTSMYLYFQLLQCCEAQGVSLHSLRPLVWGEAAVARYALRTSQSQANLSLWNQPSAGQALRLMDNTRLEATLTR